jgi:hypothetical protein
MIDFIADMIGDMFDDMIISTATPTNLHIENTLNRTCAPQAASCITNMLYQKVHVMGQKSPGNVGPCPGPADTRLSCVSWYISPL